MHKINPSFPFRSPSAEQKHCGFNGVCCTVRPESAASKEERIITAKHHLRCLEPNPCKPRLIERGHPFFTSIFQNCRWQALQIKNRQIPACITIWGFRPGNRGGILSITMSWSIGRNSPLLRDCYLNLMGEWTPKRAWNSTSSFNFLLHREAHHEERTNCTFNKMPRCFSSLCLSIRKVRGRHKQMWFAYAIPLSSAVDRRAQ